MSESSSTESPHKLEHDLPDQVPAWYRPQPAGPYQVYGPDVIRDIQRTLSVPMSGVMDEATVTHIKGLQCVLGLRPSGIVDRDTAIQIQRLRDRFSAIQE